MHRSLICALLALAGVPAFAQDAYPSRPVTLIVPFPPGGVADITGRPTAIALEKVLKQPVVLANRPGAGGALGNSLVANAKPDGYTLLMALSSISVIPEADKLFDRKPAYTLDQLMPVALISADPTLLVVHPSLPVKSLKELIALAKAKSGQMSYSTSGIYGALHMPMEMFLHATKLKMRAVHTTGGGPAITILLGGHVEMTAGGPAAVSSHVKAGRLRTIVSWGAQAARGVSGRADVQGTRLRHRVFHLGRHVRAQRHARAGDENIARRGAQSGR